MPLTIDIVDILVILVMSYFTRLRLCSSVGKALQTKGLWVHDDQKPKKKSLDLVPKGAKALVV